MKYLAILFLSILIIGCNQSRWYSGFELDEASFDKEVMEVVAQESEIVMPAGARGLHFAYKPPIDPAFLAVIEIPGAEKQQMMDQLAAIEQSQVPTSAGGLDEAVSWWKPAEGEVLIERSHFESGRTLRAVLTQQNGRLLLYLDHSL